MRSKITWYTMLTISFFIELIWLAFFEQSTFYAVRATYLYSCIVPQTTPIQLLFGFIPVFFNGLVNNNLLLVEFMLLFSTAILCSCIKQSLQLTLVIKIILVMLLLVANVMVTDYYMVPFSSLMPWTFTRIIANIIIIYTVIKYTS